MPRNTIVVSSPAMGVFIEGPISLSGTAKPGQMVQYKAGGTEQGNREQLELYNQSADGVRASGPIILMENALLGKTVDATYADGDWAFAYIPQVGEEIQVLAANLTGTGSGTDDAFAIGDKVMPDDGTGKFVKVSGTVETAPFTVKETVAALTADTLILVQYNGN